ncbi:MAG: nicotinate-nucleotide--dimethylbenzimidazole phosphoribosyltransferase [Coriobacteriia bacterium]|nr:nicotinate-nucleotide--dimethylbenzimidazole phosphoribosyltransferase [Coriobacteriia bacterium]MBN2823107.1 nicotinate-nucleotide--dimethylbenzimidazole phosphoribosyltransferase [Coriobacteriia bacterium]
MTHEIRLQTVVDSITPPDASYATDAWTRLDSLTKPPRSLGKLEELAARMAVIQHCTKPVAGPMAIALMAGDHGVVAEGVSPYPQDVTAQMVANFSAGGAAINQLAEHVGARLILVDVGVIGDLMRTAGVRHAKVRAGTRNMAQEPAMTREEVSQAMLVGVDLARELAGAGVRTIGTGEMGIGNTTAASALAAAYAGLDPADVVGRGTGLDDAGVAHKAEVIARALDVNAVSDLDALGVLAAVGGLEIAAMAGVFIGAAAAGIASVSDGFISGAALLAATRICPACAPYAFPSHRSVEPGHAAILEALALKPVLELDMRLGEGTGAALAMGVIEASCKVMSGMATFGDAGVSNREE